MEDIGRLFEQVLGLAPDYTSTATEAMKRRDELMSQCKDAFIQVVEEDGLSGAFHVGLGGRIANYAPIPFLRVFDPSHSPSATSGFYVVYLFREFKLDFAQRETSSGATVSRRKPLLNFTQVSFSG